MDTTSDWSLPKDWVIAPYIDAELKRYTLLAYVQRVQHRFAEQKLFPYLGDVHGQMEELLRFKRGKAALASNFAGPLVGFDPISGNAMHAPTEEPEMMHVIDEVIDFAVPGLRRLWSQGMELQNALMQHIHLAPVGVQPLHSAEGWLLLRAGKEARAYNFCIPLVCHSRTDEPHLSIRTRYVTTYTLGFSCTYEHMKSDLSSRYRSLPNPATFVIEADIPLPHVETMVPLAKRLVYQRSMATD